MKKVLFATSHAYLPQKSGGSESSTNDLCIFLKKFNVESAVFARLKSGDKTWLYNRIKAKLQKNSYAFDNFNSYSTYRTWNPFDDFCSVIDEYKPDVVVIQAGEVIKYAKLALEKGITCVVYLRDVDFSSQSSDFFHHDNLFYIANSTFTKDTFYKRFRIEAEVIPPIIQRENYRTGVTPKFVTFVCPVIAKGVEIAFQLAEANPNIPFQFVESWDIPKHRKEEYLLRASKSPNIKWLPRQQCMKAIYANTKLTIVPSIGPEAWGRIVSESQINGIPVIGSNIGGIPEALGDGGLLVEPNDFEKWDYALKNLWHEPELYKHYAKLALKHSRREQFSPEVLMEKFVSSIKRWHCHNT